MENQTKIILGLLSVILILAIIFGLKVTGIIKPSKKEPTNKISKNEIIDIKDKNEFVTNYERNISFKEKLVKILNVYGKTISIILFIINIILSIGIAKLYDKLGMPSFAVVFQYAYPVINLVVGLGEGFIVNSIGFLISLIALWCSCEFFGSLGMSRAWPLSVVLGIIVVAVGASLLSTFIMLLGILLILMFVYAHIVSSINLAKRNNKGLLYTMGLILIPNLFKAILGFESN